MERYKQLAETILGSVCDTDEIFEDYDLDLMETGYLDSFSSLSIIVEIEKKLGIKLQPTDLSKNDISTINNFIKYLARIGDEN